MKVQILKKDEENLFQSFLLESADPAFANTLRRVIISEVPVMAIETVRFIKNSSVLYDEMLALRLGLIALKTDLDTYEFPEDCSCDGQGCAKCQLKLTLSLKGPCTVYASDLESEDPKVVPVHPKTIIVKLDKGQELELEAIAVLGRGKVHAKWSPAHVYYKYLTKISGDEKLVEETINSCANKDKSIDAVMGKKNKFIHLCESCKEKLEKNEKINLQEDNTSFIFNVESWGQLPVQRIIQEAVEIIKSKCDEFNNKIKEI